ncbi:hypothetical protein ASC90_09315 [Rhizobium sp. Root1220]|nr:hypothetical protein ASC90_09315 [Rhizobium sp. Root1220]
MSQFIPDKISDCLGVRPLAANPNEMLGCLAGCCLPQRFVEHRRRARSGSGAVKPIDHQFASRAKRLLLGRPIDFKEGA